MSLIWTLVIAAVALIAGWVSGYYSRKKERPISRIAHGEMNGELMKSFNHLIRNQHDEAIEKLSQILKNNTDAVEIYIGLGNLFRARGQYRRAIVIHQSIMHRPDLDRKIRIQALFELGVDFQKAGFIDRAIAAFNETLKEDSKHLDALREIFHLFELEGNWESAYWAQQRIGVLTKSMDNATLSYLQVKISERFLAEGLHRQALKRLKTAIKLNERCPPAYIGIAELNLERNRPKHAAKILLSLIDLDVGYAPTTYPALRRALQETGEYDRILDVYRRVLANNPKDIHTRLALAQYYAARGTGSRAAEELVQALRDLPASIRICRMLIKLREDLGQKEEGMKTAKEFLERLEEEKPYQCGACGFRSDEILWRCPKCYKWGAFLMPTE